MKRHWAKRVARWFLFLVLGLLVLLALAVVEEHIRGRIMLDRWMKQMRAKGERFTVQEILPVEHPRPEDNGAPSVANTYLGGAVIPNQVPSSMRYVAPAKAIVAPQFHEWYVMSQFDQRFTSNGAVAMVGRSGRRGPRLPGANTNAPFTVRTSAELRADINAASNTLAALKFELQKPAFDHVLDYSGGFNTPVTYLTGQRSIAQWLRAASLTALLETNTAGAAENLSALMQLVRLQTNGPLLIDQLVRVACSQIGVSGAWEALQVDGWKDEQLTALQAAMHGDNAAAWTARCLEMERAMGGIEIDLLTKLGPDRLLAFRGVTPPAPRPPIQTFDDFWDALSEMPKHIEPAVTRLIVYPLWKFAFKDQDRLHLYQQWQPLIDSLRSQAAEPNWAKHHKSWSIDKNEDDDDAPITPKRIWAARFLISGSGLFIGAAGKTGHKAVSADAARTLAETAAALKRFQLKHRRWPATIEELVPEFFARVPLDPFDGKPLRYRAETNGTFRLYSIGTDCEDDGGDARPPTSSGGTNFLNGRDIVWPMPATRKEVEEFEINKR
jgi:hypothetical protein